MTKSDWSLPRRPDPARGAVYIAPSRLIISNEKAILFRPASTCLLLYLAAYVRLRSGSVWPAVIYHGAWNAIIKGTFDRSSVGTPLAIGESGWLTAAIAVIVVLFITRGNWKLQERPGRPLTLPSARQP